LTPAADFHKVNYSNDFATETAIRAASPTGCELRAFDMSMNSGGNAINDPATMRGRTWPCLRQFCIFLENRVGRLHDLLRHVEQHDLRVVALSIDDAVDYAVVRLMLDNCDRGREIFNLSDFPMFETDIIGVELPDDPQPYLRICMALLQAEVNIHYSYPLLYRRRGHGAIALCVDNIDQGLKVLADKGLRIITETDLLDDDEYM
jgi:hypothetical protein